jgi:2-polyprenyl-3-methyl-5-hydroxy-6-metoxy-1,4-benzoquinol methylase
MAATQQQREQWEALIVEPSIWRRVRTYNVGSGVSVNFDTEDQENLDTDLQNEFKRLAHNVDPRRLYSIDHPLARFYRLMYTDEFEDFRRSVLRENVVGYGVAEMSRGVRELLMDQTFRYFVFVEENKVSAIRFGQLIVAVAVFRNTYDEDSKKLIEGGILKSRRRLYKTLTSTVSKYRPEDRLNLEQFEYVDLSKYEIPAKYESSIAQLLIESSRNKTNMSDVLNLEGYGSLPVDDITSTSPLNVNTSVFSPLRKFVLHVMHLMGKLITDVSLVDRLKVVYVGSATPEMLRITREILPPNVALVQGIDKITNDTHTLVILDEENSLEGSVGVGEDSKLTQQISMTLAIKNNFRQHPERLVGVSMFIRPPSILSGNGTFNFLPGDIFLSPWKNPQDERLRLVWSPERFSTEIIEYPLKRFVASRKYQDYVVRPLYRFKAVELPPDLTPHGLVEGEFDSELEKYILGLYYSKFTPGKKTWAEVMDLETNILVAPRFIKGESYVWRKNFLHRYHDSIVRLHLDTPNNPLLQNAARAMRAGLFPTVNLERSPMVESIEALFGTQSEELASKVFDTYTKVEEDRRNVIMTLKDKNIFPREEDKAIMVALLKDLSKNFKEIALFEPSLRSRQDDYMYSLMTGLDRGDAVNVVHLGDSFGNLLSDVYSEIDRLRVRLENVYFEATFPMNQLWKYISREESPNFVRIKNVYELKDPIEESGLPFIVLRGYGFPPEIFNAFVKAWSGSRLFRGHVEVGPDGRITSTPTLSNLTPKERFDEVVSEKLQLAVKGFGLSCLMIGSEYESSLSFLSKTTFSRVFHMVESGAGARKVTDMSTTAQKKILNRVFVREHMVRNFVLPVEGDQYDFIFCNPVVFTRLVKDPQSAERFFSEISKAMRPDSLFQTVILDKMIRYVEESGKTIEGYGKVAINRFFEMEVLEESFVLNGVQGFSVDLKNLRSIYKGHKLGFAFVDDAPYEREEEVEEGEEEEVEEMQMSRVVSSREDVFPVSKLRRMLRVVEFVKERGERGEEIDPQAFEAYEGQAVDVGANVRRYNNLVKRNVIGLVPKRRSVLDLACGHGQDMNKWFSDESVETYIGMDASEAALDEAARRLNSRKGYKPRMVKFLGRDIFGSAEWVFDAQNKVRRGRYDVVSCQLAIHYAFSDDRVVKRFLYNVSSLMEMNGEFIVSTIDDAMIKSLVGGQVKTRTSGVVLRGEHYIVELEGEMVEKLTTSKGPVLPGVSYKFTQFPSDPMSRTTTEYIVDKDYFKAVAAEMGLELIASSNFLSEGQGDESLDEGRNALTQEDKEVVAFYKIYRFRKVAEPRDTQALMASGFKYSDSKQQFLSTLSLVDSLTAGTIEAFKRGLFLGPERGFPGPFVKEGYEKLVVMTENINSVKVIANQLKIRSRLTPKESILVSHPQETETFDMIFLSYTLSASPERFLGRLENGGSIYGTFVTGERVEELIETGESYFANYIFDLTVSRRRGTFAINESSTAGYPMMNLDSLREFAKAQGLRLEIVPTLAPPSINVSAPARQLLGLFGVYRLIKEVVQQTPPQTVVQDQPAEQRKRSPKTTAKKPAQTPQPQPQVQPEEPVVGGTPSEDNADRFVLLPGLVQKKAPGKGRDESLKASSERGLYKDLARDPRWRFKLSDEWESEEFMIRMPSGETFTSVRNAMIYYKCEFADEEDEGYMGLNRSSGLPQPEDLKPFTKAIRGKKGTQWKEREANVLRSVYEAKFTNTPNVSNDDPENLSPLRALLLTKEAQLYSNSKTRNELLEMIRRVLQRIVVA